MNDLQIQSFLVIAEEGSINSAAKKLFISPPALLKRIQQLEAEIGVPLFIRTSSGMALTKAGESCIGPFTNMLSEWNQAKENCHQITEERENVLKIGCHPIPTHFTRACTKFHRIYPQYTIDLSYFSAAFPFSYSYLDQGQLDMIKIGLTSEHPGTDYFCDNYITDRLCCIVQPNVMASIHEVSLRDLAGMTVHLDHIAYAYEKELEKINGEQKLGIRFRNDISDIYQVYQALEDHEGYICSWPYGDFFRTAHILQLKDDIFQKHCLIYREKTPIITAFIELVHSLYTPAE